jgi:hypothetical protein
MKSFLSIKNTTSILRSSADRAKQAEEAQGGAKTALRNGLHFLGCIVYTALLRVKAPKLRKQPESATLAEQMGGMEAWL